MMNFIKVALLFIVSTVISCSQKQKDAINFRKKEVDLSKYDQLYENGNWKHPDYSKPFKSLGNHRVLVKTDLKDTSTHQVIIPWRRRDKSPEKKDFVIVDVRNNQHIKNKFIVNINNEFGHIVFKPNPKSSHYYIYYLPYQSSGSAYYPKVNYKTPDSIVHNQDWLASIMTNKNIIKDLPHAKIECFQSIDDFHSFFPMEIISTKKEVDVFMKNTTKKFYLFPEYRDFPIKMIDYLPLRWITNKKHINGIKDSVSKGEFYTFQIGVFSASHDLNDLEVHFSDFENKTGQQISKNRMTCFNKEGIDLNGNSFKKEVPVGKGKIQALWLGLEIPKNSEEGTYTGQVIVTPSGMKSDTVFVRLEVDQTTINDYGDDTPKNMSRLRWLNSTIGTDNDFILKPFTPIEIQEKTIDILGRKIELNKFGFPQQISSFYTQEMTKFKDEKEDILNTSIELNVINNKGEPLKWKSTNFEITKKSKGIAQWATLNQTDEINMQISGELEFDGMLNYKINIVAKQALSIQDVNLKIDLKKDAAKYLIGLGNKGGELKENITWKWDVKKHHEGAWLGNVNKGIQFVLRDENYERPLNTNFYHNKPLNLPPSWYNEGKGGIEISKKTNNVLITSSSGARTINKGDTLHFNIRFLITPFKLINTETHFNTRFVHKYLPVDSVIRLNGTVINVHHANEINPYINYPFYNTELQKKYIDEAHSKGLKVKLYNTIRELSYKAHELFALKSLGNEILNDGKGGGHSWLQEHFKANYHAAWHANSVNDAAILNKGTSRWTNYYIEGINWLAKNNEIDGLYLDDIAFSRSTVKRIVNVMSKNRDNYVIDLHSANQFNPRDGYINSVLLYMEHLPYISRLWFGEYFEYDLPPDYWMTEVSGIPFGLTGEMLEKGGHPFRGLVYGMTNRFWGKTNPKAIWSLFNDFEIDKSEMLGYWVDRSPIKTNHKNIKSTVFINDDKILIAIGSWSNNDENIQLKIDWNKLGWDKNNATISSPEIEGIQTKNSHSIDLPLFIEKNQGRILVLK